MARYSFDKMKRQKLTNKIIQGIAKFHIGHQNTILFVLGTIFTYLLARNGFLPIIVSLFSHFGYISIFLLGFLFSFGEFTIPVSAALYIMAKTYNPFTLALVASLGSASSTFLIFTFVKHEIFDEIRQVLTKDFKLDTYKWEHSIAKHMFRSKFLQKTVPIFAGLLSALPIPTQTMATILWTVSKADTKQVLATGFIFGFIVIFTLAFTSGMRG